MTSWDILDNYFQSDPHFLTKHHLDSYNDFVTSKVSQTIRVLNPIIMIKNKDENTMHEVKVYVGGTNGSDIFINKPTLVDFDNDRAYQKILYPNEARLKDLTYQSELYANIVVDYKTSSKNDKGEPKEDTSRETFEKVKIGAIPIMLHSRLCALYNQPPEVRKEMGECQYDQGGYFVIDGKEKVIVAQERIATNRVFINRSKDPKYSYEGLVRCTSVDNPLFPKTVNFFVSKDHLEKDLLAEITKTDNKTQQRGSKDDQQEPENDNAANEAGEDDDLSSKDKSKKQRNAIFISIPNVEQMIPICVLFRALGVESDKEIIRHVVYDEEKPEKQKIIDFLENSIVYNINNQKIHTQDEALTYLSNLVKYKAVDEVKHILINDLFPNVGYSFKNKALFLGYVLEKLIRVCLGANKESDRDSYIYKRVDISGFLMGNLFRDYYNQFRNELRNRMDNEYFYGTEKNEAILKKLIKPSNLSMIFNPTIIENGLKSSLKGSWGKSMVEETQDLDLIKEGVVQDLSRISYLGTISHLRRVNTPLDPTAKIVEPHRLHSTQWGVMCPCESPDGASIGLLKNMAILCHITFDYSFENIIQCIRNFNKKCLPNEKVMFLQEVQPIGLYKMTKIMINSNWTGVCPNPKSLFQFLKLCKRNSIINIFTSIAWNVVQGEINILTEAGRCCRPLFVVDNGNLLIKNQKWKFNWHTFLSNVENYRNVLAGDEPLKNVFESLYISQSPIEFVDVEEANCSLIAMTDADITKSSSYCEIHPSTILSVVSHTIPFANHNQAPRNIFSGAQGKQAIGWYACNFNNRIDTMSYMLYYPQKCLVNTRYMEHMNMNRLPNGENLIVAFCTFTGYNQEDAILMNKNSIQRGMFNLTYYKNIIDKEDENQADNERFVFTNPLKLANEGKIEKLKYGNFNTLDENGFPILNKWIREQDAIVGKCAIKKEKNEDSDSIFDKEDAKETYKDKTMIADKTVSGIVDKVFVYLDNDNKKTCKIRLRKIKTPELGDKCCCYDEKTQILTLENGWKYFKDLKKEDKVATLVNNALVYQNPIDIQSYEIDGDMYTVKTDQVNLVVTDNHRMYVRKACNEQFEITLAKDIQGKPVYYKKNVSSWKPSSAFAPENLLYDNGDIKAFKIDDYFDNIMGIKYEGLIMDIDKWLTFLGIWLAEGSIIYDMNTELKYIKINIEDERSKRILESTCDDLHININRWDERYCFIYNKVLADYLVPYCKFILNNPSRLTEYVPDELPDFTWYLNQKQCKTLLSGMTLNPNTTFVTSSSAIADRFQQLCLHAGFSCNMSQKDRFWILRVNGKENEPIVKEDSLVHYVGTVRCCTVPCGDGVLYVRREGVPVWSGNSRHAQKGVVGMIIPAYDMPYTKDGIVPDIIINPHAIPSRMTIGHLLECLLGKCAAMHGTMIDGTPFCNYDFSDMFTSLEKFGLHRYGDEILYNGMTGIQLESNIFIGPTYYERLKHMVAEKINYRSSGPITAMTRQPTQGRGNGGGLRIGEMEMDALWSHGAMAFLKESMMERSDYYTTNLDEGSNFISDVKGLNTSCLHIPFAMKQFLHELTGMSIKPNLFKEIIPEDEENYDDYDEVAE